ncbi:hypothetical protein N8371_05030 [Vicingaceae bacterium]|nr:hypothetical protein [Vicingaceae bacterium]
MNIVKTSLKSIIALTLAGVLFSCADAPKKSESTEEVQEEVIEEVEPMKEESMEDSYFMMPSPIQIAAMFNRAGLKYEGGITNPTSNVSKYNTKTARFLNFGVYSADLAYAVLNGERQASLDYIKVIRELSDKIGMPAIFEGGKLLTSFEKNIDNQDSILFILTTIKLRTDDYLAENNDESKEAVFFAAAWIEGMYLGSKSATTKSSITARIVEQMSILNNVIGAIKNQDDPSLELTYLIEGLVEIQNTFEGFAEVKSLDNPDVSFSDVELTNEEITVLNKEIETLRTNIING